MGFNSKTNLYDGYIYKITNKINKKSYIGQTSIDVFVRWKQHILKSKKNDCYFHRAINKYGEYNFEIEIIKEISEQKHADLKKELNYWEKYYIEKYNTFNPVGYNSTHGEDGKFGKPCVLYDYNGNIIENFTSVCDAINKTGLSNSSIWSCCNGIVHATRLGVFRYKEDSFDKYAHEYRPDYKKPIIKYDCIGNIIQEYDSLLALANEQNTTKTTIGRWLKSHKLINNEFCIFSKYENFDKNKITYEANSVDMYKDNVYIKTFNNKSEAARYINGDPSSVSKCASGKLKQVKGYTFKIHEINI